MADGALVGPVGACAMRLVHHQHRRSAGAVAVVEEAAFDQPRADGLEVFPGDGIPIVDVLDRAARLRDEALDRGVVGIDRTRPAEGRWRSPRKSRPAACSLDRVERAVEAADRGRVAVGRRGQREAHGQHVGRDRIPHSLPAASRTLSPSGPSRSAAPAPAPVRRSPAPRGSVGRGRGAVASRRRLQRVVQRRRPHVDDRREAEGDARRHARSPSVNSSTCQSMPISPTRGMLPALVATSRRSPPNASSMPKTAPVQRKQNALDDELLQQRAEVRRRSRRGPRSRGGGFGARQQQVRHVHAGDQQHEAHRAQQHQHGAAYAFDHFILEAGEDDGVVLRMERMAAGPSVAAECRS